MQQRRFKREIIDCQKFDYRNIFAKTVYAIISSNSKKLSIYFIMTKTQNSLHE